MPYLILIAAILAFVLPFVVLRWSDPYRQERKRALRTKRVDERWAKWTWPES